MINEQFNEKVFFKRIIILIYNNIYFIAIILFTYVIVIVPNIID